MARMPRLLGRLLNRSTPAPASAAPPPPEPVLEPEPVAPPAAVATAPSPDDVLRPRDLLDRGRVLLGRAAQWFRDLDKDKAIHTVFEWPGAHVVWALKLGRFPIDQQLLRRDANTMAGVLTWLFVVSAVLQMAAFL